MIEANLQLDGRAEYTINGNTRTIHRTSLEEARSELLQALSEEAAKKGEPINAVIRDPEGNWPLTINPDGSVQEGPGTLESTIADAELIQEVPAAVATDEDQSAAESPAQMPVPDEPADNHAAPTEQEPTSINNPAQPTEEKEQEPAMSANVEAAAAPAAATPNPGPFPWNDDPEWKTIAAQPAAQGIRAVFKLRPSETELAARQADFKQLKEEQAARAEEEARRTAEQEQLAVERSARRQQREAERAAHLAKLTRSIQTNFQGTRTLLVANPKGGARKTTTAYLLAATIGLIRGGSTVAWDANETMGTLGERALQDRHNRTVVDLLENGAQHFLDIESARVGVLDGYVRNQGDCHFDVLASDENPERQDQIDAEGFNKVHDILSHFYRMIVVDTGNNIRAAHFVEAQKHTDQLVIPVAASYDSKNRALDMIATFTAAGHDDLVKNAVVLVHELEPIEHDENGNVISTNGHEMTAAEIAEAFGRHVRTVLPIPYDPALKDGGTIKYFDLDSKTIDAYREAAAAITDSLIDTSLESSGCRAAAK